MNKEEFRKQLEQYADIIDLKPSVIPGQRNDEFVNVIIDDELVFLGSKFNPTLGIKVEFKDRFASCSLGCGNIVPNQIIESSYYTKPCNHWRHKCSVCKNILHPSGQGFTNPKQAYNSVLTWFEKEKTK